MLSRSVPAKTGFALHGMCQRTCTQPTFPPLKQTGSWLRHVALCTAQALLMCMPAQLIRWY